MIDGAARKTRTAEFVGDDTAAEDKDAVAQHHEFVGVRGAYDRGQTFLASADTLVLLVTTFLVLLLITRLLPGRVRRKA